MVIVFQAGVKWDVFVIYRGVVYYKDLCSGVDYLDTFGSDLGILYTVKNDIDDILLVLTTGTARAFT